MENFENITATEAARGFSDLLHSVHYQRRSFLITKGSRVMAQLVPVDAPKKASLTAWMQNAHRPRLSPEDCDAYEEILKETRAMPSQNREWNEE